MQVGDRELDPHVHEAIRGISGIASKVRMIIILTLYELGLFPDPRHLFRLHFGALTAGSH